MHRASSERIYLFVAGVFSTHNEVYLHSRTVGGSGYKISYLIVLDLSIGYFITSQRREKLSYGSEHKLHIGNKI